MSAPQDPDLDEILAEFHDRRAKGEPVTHAEYLARYPALREELAQHFETMAELDQLELADPAYPDRNQRIGDYRLVRLLGRGSMGVVYLAEHVRSKRTFALKVLGSALTQSEGSLERFRREARSAQKLRHPNLIAVHEFGESQGYPYYAMDHVDGVTLAHVIRRLRTLEADGIVEPSIARVVEELVGKPVQGEVTADSDRYVTIARIVRKVADALSTVHAAHVIHRDVKPQNILIQADLEPRLGDFGLSKDAAFESLSRSGTTIGTPHYMSPEMVRRRGTPIDHRTDVYSLGATLYELLALGVPFAGGSVEEVFSRIAEEDPPLLAKRNRNIPRPLQAIALRALEKRPDDRYPDCAAMAADLDRFLAGEPVHARLPSPARRFVRIVRRHGVALTAAGFCAAFAGYAILASRTGQAATHGVEIRAAEAAPGARLRIRPLGGRAPEHHEDGPGPWHFRGEPGQYLVTVADPGGTVRERQISLGGPGAETLLVLTTGHDSTTPRPGMVRVPGGTYTVGYDPPPKAATYAHAERTVEIATFDIDRCEVSNAEYLEFVLANPKRRLPWENGAFEAQAANHPVTGVTWHDAKAYAEWRGKRLPTDVEWEIAGRGPAALAYSWGSEFSLARPRANLAPPLRSGNAAAMELGALCDVGSETEDRSWIGVLHMVGNAREWVADPWTPRATPSHPGTSHEPELQGLAGAGNQTVRGASCAWPPSASWCRLAERRPENGERPAEPMIGFRCASTVSWLRGP